MEILVLALGLVPQAALHNRFVDACLGAPSGYSYPLSLHPVAYSKLEP